MKKKGFTMKKILLLLLLLSNFLNASMLLDKNTPVCIEDYYIKNGSLYYLKSENNNWVSTDTNKLVQYIYYGYSYNSDNGKCEPQQYNILGISPMQWNFLTALTGLLFGFVFMFFTIELFTKVGARR